jgi:hypothetical protein
MPTQLNCFDITFPSLDEATFHLDGLGYRRAPIKGLVKRYQAEAWGDNGEPLLVLASSTFHPAEDGSVTINFAEYRID